MKISKRETFWKKRTYRVVESGKGWSIMRPGEEVPDLNLLLAKALRKKRYKWE